MSNVIALNVPPRRLGASARRAALVDSFARFRRFGDDVFWLKENAELLNILECTGLDLGPAALAPHEAFYADIERRLGFFPQYYRFLLSICLDLEDLGMPGDKGEALCRWAAHEGLADAELSDLQRAEARRLMQRRGIDPLPDDTGLEDRLRLFMDRSETFAVPNKKAAYELTHIVFYLSEYGRRDPELSPAAAKSLEFAGILSYLEQNVDLLAEVCVAMRYAGIAPSPIWEGWLEREAAGFTVLTGAQADTGDAYHEYLVSNWAMAVAGRRAFGQTIAHDRISFHRSGRAGPLREISQCMFQLDDARSDDWERMRPLVQDAVTETGRNILAESEASSARFAEFFAGFARTGLRGVAL